MTVAASSSPLLFLHRRGSKPKVNIGTSSQSELVCHLEASSRAKATEQVDKAWKRHTEDMWRDVRVQHVQFPNSHSMTRSISLHTKYDHHHNYYCCSCITEIVCMLQTPCCCIIVHSKYSWHFFLGFSTKLSWEDGASMKSTPSAPSQRCDNVKGSEAPVRLISFNWGPWCLWSPGISWVHAQLTHVDIIALASAFLKMFLLILGHARILVTNSPQPSRDSKVPHFSQTKKAFWERSCLMA